MAQSYVSGNGKIENITLEELKEWILKNKAHTWIPAERYLKRLKLRIAGMNKLSL